MKKLLKRSQYYTGRLAFCGFAVFLAACSPVEFAHDESCGKFGNQECVVSPQGLNHFDNTIEVGNGKVDILFVNDNSGSMSVEQEKMGERFPHLTDSLEDLDFNIAMITTDAADEGKFINFSNGISVLTSAMGDIASLFLNTIVRPETLACDTSGFNFDNCPSSDERAILTANMVVSRADPEFFRDDAHFAIVILSDEDERSNSGEIPGYPLEAEDTPPNLINNVKNTLAEDKTLSVHAVVIRPGDTECLREQVHQENVKGFYGSIYADLAEMTNGTVSSICADDYGVQLEAIGENILSQVNSVELACAPVDEEVTVIVTPEPSDFEFLVDSENHRVWFNQNLPPDTKARVVYDCFEE